MIKKVNCYNDSLNEHNFAQNIKCIDYASTFVLFIA